MYIVINSTDDRICAEWNYITEKQKHICWKTPQEIEFDNSYKNDTTHMKNLKQKKQLLNLFVLIVKMIVHILQSQQIQFKEPSIIFLNTFLVNIQKKKQFIIYKKIICLL